jgi:small-conductance mechanosensitive channel
MRMCRALTGLSVLLCLLFLSPAWALNAGLGEPPPSVDRESPSATARGFSDAVHRGDYVLAAHYLDLDFLPPAEQREKGPLLARRLKFVLDHKLPLALSSLGREPEEQPSRSRFVELGLLAAGGESHPIRLAHVVAGSGKWVWVFSEATVRAIEPLHEAYGPAVLAQVLPRVFFEKPVLGLEPWQWLGLLLGVVGAWVLAVLLERLSLAVERRLLAWTRLKWDEAVVLAGRGPLRVTYFALLGSVGAVFLMLPPTGQLAFNRLFTSLLILAVAWFVLRVLRLTTRLVQQNVTQGTQDAGRGRGIQTQLAMLRHVFEVVTYVVAAALLLMQFETVRNVGVSLLASAGIAGLVIGLAAQKSISSLLAGIQLSITQPIRIGDTVIVENEWGTVEEITLTYVVVKVWDERRLVVPISQFLDKPFQNWSKGGSESMLGPVLLLVDFTADMEALRAELRRILENEGKALWDGKVAGVVVLDVLDRTLQVRCLVSAHPSRLFDIRCLVREKMMSWLRARPEWLPITRTEPRQPAQVPVTAEPRPEPPLSPRA